MKKVIILFFFIFFALNNSKLNAQTVSSVHTNSLDVVDTTYKIGDSRFSAEDIQAKMLIKPNNLITTKEFEAICEEEKKKKTPKSPK